MILVDDLPFVALFHHDGRFMRGAGIFAFARYEADGALTILHLEPSDAINRAAIPSHPRWAWAMEQGMNRLLVHLNAARRRAYRSTPVTVQFHPEARRLQDSDLPRTPASLWPKRPAVAA